jgi:hypothetical protein
MEFVDPTWSLMTTMDPTSDTDNLPPLTTTAKYGEVNALWGDWVAVGAE